MGMLKGKTVLLVTHMVHIVKEAERIIVLDNGEVIGDGNFQQLQSEGVDISTLMDVKKKVLRDGGETYEMHFDQDDPEKNEIAPSQNVIDQEDVPLQDENQFL